MLNGDDISDNQGNIDNTQVPGNFSMVKATEGVGWTDPDCDPNVQQDFRAGKLVGVYSLNRPDGNDPISEADYLTSQITGYIGRVIVALDQEPAYMPANRADIVGWVLAKADRVYANIGVAPLIYMDESLANEFDWSPVSAKYSLWLAVYGANGIINGYQIPSTPPTVNGNWTVAMWQYSSNDHQSGYSGPLDADVFYGDATTWAKYAAVQSANPVITPPPALTPPVVDPVLPTPVDPPVVPEVPIIPPVETEPTTQPVVPVVAVKTPLQKSLLELLRLAIFALPTLLIQLFTNDPALALGFGGPVLLALKSIDEYVHKNPNTNLNGLLPF